MKVAADFIGVVDDNEGVRVALDGLLRSERFRVLSFPSAEALLTSTCLPKITCLVLDLHLPGADGLSLLRRLAVNGRQIATMVLTAHGDAETHARAIDDGAVAFLTKPLDGCQSIVANRPNRLVNFVRD